MTEKPDGWARIRMDVGLNDRVELKLYGQGLPPKGDDGEIAILECVCVEMTQLESSTEVLAKELMDTGARIARMKDAQND